MTSRLRSFLYIFFTGFFFCAASAAYAGDGSGGHALSDRVAKAHRSGTIFQAVSLFTPTAANKHDFLEKETILQPLGAQIADLYESHPQAISLTLHTNDGQEYKLEMLQSHPTSEQANMGYIDATGRHKIAFTDGLHYQGNVAGTEQSMAAMSVFASGEVMLLFANGEGNFVLGKLEDGSGKYILYNDHDMRSRPYNPCGVSDNDYRTGTAHVSNAKTTKSLLCNKVKVYWEVSYNVYTSKSSSLTATQTYITGLFNQFQAMYANETIAMELKSMYVWIVQDDYSTASSSAALDRFRAYWNSLGDGFDGDIAHLLTRDNSGSGGGNGGLAYVDVLCGRTYAYGYSDIYGSYQTIPTWSWDVEVITHETGHNLGSKHTHWCGWMTGAGGTCGSIDNCTTQETTTSCSSCGALNLNSAPVTQWKGTVMSYCHLVARGINLANGFGPLPGAVIRNNVSTSTCLESLISAKLTPAPICTNDGAVSLVYAANNFGTSPYTYTWSNNLHTQNLAAISSPGTYSVQIKDSNGCTANYSTDVIHKPGPGNGITPTEVMPVCCNNSGIALTLKSAAPQNLTSCQSVYWLRSAALPGTYALAKAIFDTTQAANILVSTNNSSIDNSTGATLDVHPPVSCTSKLTYYYTPIVVQLPHTANNITVTSSGSTVFQSFSTTIGRYVNLPDQTSAPTACDLLDTPTVQTVTVTVSGYTGRANNMRLVVQDASDRVLYERFGIVGNGTYTIPASAMSGPILQALKISAFDFNCTTTTCIASSVSVSAVRNVTYGARALSAAAGCTVGTSIRVDFAQSGCTKLAVENAGIFQSNAATLYPNPASKSVTLKFTSSGSGATQLKVTDMLGKTVLLQETSYDAGNHQQVIDVHTWAKGFYFVNISSGQASAERLKLVVE